MSQDLKLAIDDDGIYDLSANGNDLAVVEGFETAIQLALFTDSRTDSGEVQEAFDREGWAGNLLTTASNFELGGELWLLDQARLDNLSINRAQDFAYNSLLYLIDRGIADRIEIEITKRGTRGIYIRIEMFKGSNIISRYDTLWRNTKGIG